jgi:hypothetical protein
LHPAFPDNVARRFSAERGDWEAAHSRPRRCHMLILNRARPWYGFTMTGSNS